MTINISMDAILQTLETKQIPTNESASAAKNLGGALDKVLGFDFFGDLREVTRVKACVAATEVALMELDGATTEQLRLTRAFAHAAVADYVGMGGDVDDITPTHVMAKHSDGNWYDTPLIDVVADGENWVAKPR